MAGYVIQLEEATQNNTYFRKVLFTAMNCQLVVMSLKPGEDIGEEVHTLDQFIRVEHGKGKAVLNGEETLIQDGWAVVIPAGTKHNIINMSENEDLKLYTIYAPPEHRDGTIHKTKEEAMADEADEYKG